MATFARHVDVEWTGNLMEGSGTAKAGTGAFSLPVTFPSRIDPKGDSNEYRRLASFRLVPK